MMRVLHAVYSAGSHNIKKMAERAHGCSRSRQTTSSRTICCQQHSMQFEFKAAQGLTHSRRDTLSCNLSANSRDGEDSTTTNPILPCTATLHRPLCRVSYNIAGRRHLWHHTPTRQHPFPQGVHRAHHRRNPVQRKSVFISLSPQGRYQAYAGMQRSASHLLRKIER